MVEHQGARATTWPPLETIQSSLIGIIAFSAAIAPLGVPTLLALLVVVTLAQDRAEGQRLHSYLPTLTSNAGSLYAIMFMFFAFLSCAWALRPGYTFVSLSQNAFVGLGSWYVAMALDRRLRLLGRGRQTRFTRALPLAFVFAALYFLLDALTGDSITLFFARKAPWIFDGFENVIRYTRSGVPVGLASDYFNRIAAALVMMLPGLAAAFLFWPWPRWGRWLGSAAFVVLVLVCEKSGSATALLALVAGAVLFIFALYSAHWARRLLQVGFLILIVGAVPLAMVPRALKLDESALLPFSFRERVIIWDDLASLSLNSPILGIGAKSIKFWPALPSHKVVRKSEKPETRKYWHPHNGYLQVWLELGAIGAALFALAGTLLLGRIGHLGTRMQPYAIALAAGTLVMIGPGWGLWQPWLIGSIGFGWLALLMVSFEFEQSQQPDAAKLA